jgi:transposase
MQNAAKLSSDSVDLHHQLTAAQQKIEQQKNYIDQLEEFIRNLRQKQFGASSEQQNALQPSLFDETESNDHTTADTEESASITVAAHTRIVQKSARIPAELPREEIVHDLLDVDKICPHDGTPLKCIGAETSEQLDIVPAQVKVLQHVRRKYACPCCEQYLITAPKPKQPIEKSLAAPGLLAYVATQKYVDALPLYRQTEIFKRIGVDIDRTTLANWMVACGKLIQPLINLIHEKMFDQSVLHMDETRVQVLNEPGRSAQQQSYMWVLRSLEKPAVLYRYAPSRSGDIAKELLGDYHGALMVDGYDGYNGVCTQQQLTRLGCWSHARRKFIEAKKAQAKNKVGTKSRRHEAKPIKPWHIFNSCIALSNSRKKTHPKSGIYCGKRRQNRSSTNCVNGLKKVYPPRRRNPCLAKRYFICSINGRI